MGAVVVHRVGITGFPVEHVAVLGVSPPEVPALAGLLRAVAAFAFRPLLIAVAAVGAGAGPVRRAILPAGRPRQVPARLLVHSVGRRGPPLQAFALA